MFPTRTCPHCGNKVWATLDRCPHDGTPLGASTSAPDPRPSDRVSPEPQRSLPPSRETPRAAPAPVPPQPKATPAAEVAHPGNLTRATDLTVDISDERPADKRQKSDDLSIFDTLARPGSGADGRASALDDSMRPPRNRAGRSGRLGLFLILVIVAAGLAAWAHLRPVAKAPAPPPIAPVATPAPPPPAVPTPEAPSPTQAVAPVPAPPSPSTTPPAPAKSPTSEPVTASPKAATRAAKPPRGKAAPRRRPSSRLYGVPVPAEFMPKNPETTP